MDTEKDFSKFSKTIKIYDDLDSDPDNIIKILESSNMHLGTGSRIWECGMVLSKYFIKQNFDGNIKLKDKRILELGGGTGYLSIALSVLGSNVICTDLKEVLGLMSENIEINKEIIAMKGGKIEIREMDWNSKKEEIEDILKDVDGFDYVVAADVVFNKGHLGSLTKCLMNIYEILKEKNTKGKMLPELLLCYKSRNEEIDDEIVKYLEKMRFEGTQVI